MDDYLACVGGPMDGHWFTREDWTERVAASQRMADLNQTPSACLSYRESDEITTSHHTNLTGRVLHWTPATIPA